MDPSQTCRSCGKTKPLSAYRLSRHGKHVPTCRTCQCASANANTRAKALADPDYAAKLRQQMRDSEARRCAAKVSAKGPVAVARHAERAAARVATAEEIARSRELAAARAEELAARVASLTAEAEAVERRITASGMLDQKSRPEREKALKDSLWNTMRDRRALREQRAVKPRPDARHRIKLKGNGGYISVTEFAARVAEREACHRAGEARTLLPYVSKTIALLERDTAGPERTRDMRGQWCRGGATAETSEAAQDDLGAIEADPFDDAFGDWAPEWMGSNHGSWTASLAA